MFNFRLWLHQDEANKSYSSSSMSSKQSYTADTEEEDSMSVPLTLSNDPQSKEPSLVGVSGAPSTLEDKLQQAIYRLNQDTSMA